MTGGEDGTLLVSGVHEWVAAMSARCVDSRCASRSKQRRITFAPPLAVTFRIEDDGKTVSVLRIRLFRRRKP